MDSPSTNGSGHSSDPAKFLRENHLAELRASGLTDTAILAGGFHSEDNTSRIRKLLNWQYSASNLGSALVIPYHAPNGEPLGYVRVKPTTPRADRSGKLVKYEAPMGHPPRAYFAAGFGATTVTDATVPLVITEGEKKAAAGQQAGFATVAVAGVWSWQKGREHDDDAPRELINDLAAITWTGRTVYLVFDSDLATNIKAQWAEYHLAQVLTAKGAVVKIVRLPEGPAQADGKPAKVGLDDYLLTHTADDLGKLLSEAVPPKKPADVRPEIVLGPLEFLSIEQGIKALAQEDKHIYQRGGQLTRVVWPCHPIDKKHLRSSLAPRIEAIPLANLRTRLTKFAQVVEITVKKDAPPEKHLTHPPGWLVNGIESAGVWDGIRPLEAVVTAPALLHDGTVLQCPGYDAPSGLLYAPDAEYEPVPELPSLEDAKRAWGTLAEVVCDFPFAKPAHRSAWLAALLTTLARHAFHSPSPMFLVDGNTRGVGKGLLVDTIATIAYGRELARAPYSIDDNEMRKTIMAIAIAGEPAVMLDNIGGFLGSPSFDAALTSTEWEDRILGVSQRLRMPLRVVWLGTGNNVALLADTARRICPIRLETQEERPEDRTGLRHPKLLEWVRSQRPKLLTAALTILRAFCVAGRPDMKLVPWGSFEGWSDVVRNAVVWCGLPDPAETRLEMADKSDQDAKSLRGMLAGWKEIDPDREGKTVADVLKELDRKEAADSYPTLRQVLADTFDLSAGKLPSSRKLGNTLRKFSGRLVAGECFQNKQGHGGVALWYVSGQNGGNDGKSGGSGGFGGSATAYSHAHARWENENKDIESNTPTRPTTPTNSDPSEVFESGCPYTVVTDPDGLVAVCSAVSESPTVALDTETTGLCPRSNRLRLLSLTVTDLDGGLHTYVIDCFQVDPSPLWDTLAEATIIGHNISFDLGFLTRLGFAPGAVRDTMLLSLLLHGSQHHGVRHPKGFHGLGAVVERELGQTLHKDLQKSDWSGALTRQQLEYAAADTVVLLPLYQTLTKKIAEAGLQRVADIEARCLPALSWLSLAGVGFDVVAWDQLAEEAHREATAIAQQLDEAAPDREGYFSKDGAWNWNSPDQVKEAFKLVGVKLTSSDDDALAQVKHPLAALLRTHRSKSKLGSTYGPSWYKDALHAGRIHAGWKQLGADSGRMACSAPNLQNLPGDVRYRHCFRAPDGRMLVRADYSQIELRIAARIANDQAMLDAYGRGDDLHTLTAQRVLGVAEVTKQDRKLAKALNFGLLYGMGSKGFQKYAQSNYGVEMTLEEAERYRNAFFDAYPGLRRWHRKVRDAHALETRTRAGRRRLIGDKEFDTLRLNSPVQGTGADGLKQALALLWERRDQCPGAFPVLVVHDEIVVEADNDKADSAAAWLKAAMLDGMAPLIDPVPVEVEVKIARTWGGD